MTATLKTDKQTHKSLVSLSHSTTSFTWAVPPGPQDFNALQNESGATLYFLKEGFYLSVIMVYENLVSKGNLSSPHQKVFNQTNVASDFVTSSQAEWKNL